MDNTQQKETKTPAITSTKNTLRFVRFSVNSFAGISEDAKLVIVFDDPSKRVLEFKGDQGTGKTSSLQGLFSLLGGALPDNAINTKDKNIDEELVLERNGEKYVIRQTKSSFTVTKWDAEGTRSVVKSPKDFLNKIIGAVGLNPMDLKSMDGKKQIAWIRTLTAFSPEQLALEAELADKYDKEYKARTEVNRVVKQLHGEILSTNYYSWDKENSVFLPTPQFEEHLKTIEGSELDENVVAQNVEEANKKKQQYDRCEQEMVTLKQNRQYAENRIAQLKEQLAAAEKEHAEIEKRIIKGEDWLKDNNTCQEEYDKAFEAMKNLSTIKQYKANLVNVENKVKLYTANEEESTLLDGKLLEIDNLKKAFVKSYTPEIEGLEIVVPGIDVAKAEGIYFRGKTMQMLSESELFELYIQLLAAQNVKVTIIENITSLGSAAIEKINEYVEKTGGYVFYSAMQRGQDKISVQFVDKIQ